MKNRKVFIILSVVLLSLVFSFICLNRFYKEKVVIEMGFENSQVEKAITDYLLTQNYFSWQTTQGSSNFCAIANLYPESSLFPLYIWVSCGEFVLVNENLEELSGMAAPIKINYPNELFFYDLNKFSFQAPMDGTFYLRDIEEIFPKEAQERIPIYVNDKLGKKLRAIALSALKEGPEK